MKKITLSLLLVLGSVSSFAYADDYNSASDAANPPETFAEDPGTSDANPYGSTQQPVGRPNAPPAPITKATPPPPQAPIKPNHPSQNTPDALGDGSGDDGNTMHDPDPEADDVGTAPVQPS